MSTVLRQIEVPPLWLGLLMLAGWALAEALPLGLMPAMLWPGRLLIGAGLALMIWAALTMLRARTAVMPRSDAAALVTGGPFRLTRNPIYLGDALIMVGFGLAIGSVWPFMLTPLFVWIITERFIRGEEAMLRERFPEAFAAWASRVRRWI